MQLNGRRSSSALAFLQVLLAGLSLASAPEATAENRVSVRGVYYREPSTRVVQPMVDLEKDLPAGYSVGAHFLLDAITSASIAQGAQGQDVLLNERRSEVRLSAGRTFDRTYFGGAYRHSQEPDYLSDTFGLSIRQGVWENSATVGLNVAYGHDHLPRRSVPNDIDVVFIGVVYEQILSPVTVAQVAYDFTYQTGFLANDYLRGPFGRELVPDVRLRHAPTIRLAHYLPALTLGLQLHYRFYVDHGKEGSSAGNRTPWGLTSHTIETRVYKELSRELEVRGSYRYHTQGRARFWCNAVPLNGGDPGCYKNFDLFKSVDEKFGPLGSHYAELKLTWELRRLGGVPVLGWFEGGALELSYGRFVQSTHYGGAHLLQTGYSLPF